MTEQELKDRTKKFALRVIKLVRTLPKNDVGSVLGKQILRSATSVAANYRSACKARSLKDFANNLGICEEEADETQLWIELIVESDLVKPSLVEGLWKECDELVAIFASSRITMQKKLLSSKNSLSRKNNSKIVIQKS